MPHPIKPFFIVGGLVLVVYLAICAILYATQRSYMYFPQPPSNAHAFDMNVPGAVLKINDRILDGQKAVIYFGGNASSVGWEMPAIQKIFPDRSLYLMNYRGYGGSTGKPTENDLNADAAALYAHVKASHSDILVMGVSLGTGIAIRLASEQDVSGLVLVTPHDSALEIAQDMMPRIPVKWLLIDRYESWRYAPNVTAPTALLIAGQDAVLPSWSAEKLATRFNPGVAKVYRFPDAEHHTMGSQPGFVSAIQSVSKK